ncbi:MAG: ABC transporter ATP-binding protein [Sphaerochaetaceae bacterium]
MNEPPAIQLEGISKRYNDVQALDDVSLDVRRGEIICLAGENGAGKTTLMKILYGMEQPDSGTIRIDGKEVSLRSPLDSAALGIGMVHQHFMLVGGFTVAQNAALGIEKKRFGSILDTKATEDFVQKKIDEFGLSLKATDCVDSLTVGQRQQAEILRLLCRNDRIMILDEPTSVLTEEEVSRLFSHLKAMAGEGETIVLITHKLDEIKRISDRVAILTKGRMTAIRRTSDVTEDEISKLMFGSSVKLGIPRQRASEEGKTVLSLHNVCVKKQSQEKPLLCHVSFDARAGEILGFAGVSGNGLGVLEGVLGGFIRTSEGTITLRGQDITGLPTRELRKNGLSYVPADRIAMGSCAKATVSENLIAPMLGRFSLGPFLDRRRIREFSEDRISKFGIKASPDETASSLSGGNIQKMILSRETVLAEDCIVLSQPTWGLDRESSQFVYLQMQELRKRKIAVILISYSLDEILAVADRIVIISKGRIAGIMDNKEGLSREKLGRMMLGKEDRDE